MAGEPPTRPSRESIEEARQRANAITAARRAERLKATRGVSYEKARWRELSPEAQDKFNKLRMARGQAPLSPVKARSDPYIAPPGQLRPLDPNDIETVIAARNFLGLDEDRDQAWKATAESALKLVQYEAPEGTEAYTKWKYLLIADLIRTRLLEPASRKLGRTITWAVRSVHKALAKIGIDIGERTIWNAWEEDYVKRVVTTPRIRVAWLANWRGPPAPKPVIPGARHTVGTHDCKEGALAVLKENDPGVVHCLACGMTRKLTANEMQRFYAWHGRWRDLHGVTATEASPLQ
jgi:hypothetical protein